LKKSLISLATAIVGFLAYMFTHNSNSSFGLPQPLCLSQFYQDTTPELINPKLKNNSYPLCYEGFSLNYSGITKTPLWVAEKLNPERLRSKIKRENNFHEEERLPTHARALLSDYKNSGFDRGHMAPNGDMGDKASQYDSFSLANMIPQHPDNNQNTWREIEETTRTMVTKYRLEAYVVTGGAFLKRTVKPIKKGHDVLVPSHVYKAVYFPQIGMASAYLSVNDDSRQTDMISICALEEKTGINIFPQLEEHIKRQVYAFPLRASQVKANKQPVLKQQDLVSQCAPQVSAAQIKNTQQQFIIGKNYNSVLNLTQHQKTTQDKPLSPELDFNALALAAVHWFKTQENK
jgi:endonuclease G